MMNKLIFLPVLLSFGVAAQATDLPKPVFDSEAEPLNLVEPMDYVQVCDAYGEGYFYIPGTQTCLRLSGRVRTEAQYRRFPDKPTMWGGVPNTEASGRDLNSMRFRARSYIRMDARSETEFGFVRAFSELRATVDSDSERYGDSPVMDLDKAYIQFGGFTVGRTGSLFDFFTGATFGSVHRDWSDANSWTAAYTEVFDDGLSVTVSLEDPVYRAHGVFTEVGGENGQAGNKIPDVVAAFRLDGEWGSAKVAGAVTNIRPEAAYASGEVGWALGAGAIIYLPQMGSQDAMALQFQYGNGAVSYAGIDDDEVFDAYYINGDTRKTNALSFSGGLTHYVTPEVRTDFDASYAVVDTPTGAALPDFDRLALDWDLVWSPVSGMEMGVDLGYARTSPEGVKDFDEASALFRVQKTF
ncbi:Porin omp2b precursor [Pseudovibrio axinellae]|uniref:Porin n=1 Tax=Pseudovibrio axinellae TaxID=989403 RepID=A0A165WQ60_9HYPH|nr:porin [Pseudovibrio axinellae]KZL16784.1 Porin omp2b precursor [Pseudovibrio axinellae]SEQ74747.1 Porin subfamily protein [Pseudovibrio axinellae]